MLVLVLALPGAALARTAGSAAGPVAAAAGFDKTKFVFDVGTASYAVHHFIYAPFKAGKLHGIRAYIKGGLAAAYAVHALKKAYAIANSGNSKLLHAIVSPLNALIATLTTVGSQIKHGVTSGVEGANSDLGALSSAASGAGVAFKDKAVSL